ncbi:Cof-type HAD-IIB family hydrolase [Clostridium sp. MSJ-8]|uniref:Cof-type HAD-IIB family hydrolase n=1 Tax=Clostridium sp. MSJ-8 TaxID=2841510 RepID=UPI001C0EC23B|nr:HAD family hydrolase [Clostridium sp. MSJ-8]MBU5486746.1 Cof-type HAD-IIB family hydrolase [Clostridium sp. MSJ-8]
MKILASDLDGTLVQHRNKILDRDIQGLKQLKNKGHKFVICTGRTYNGVEGLIDKYNIDYDYLVLCNGGFIVNRDQEVILDEWIDEEYVSRIADEFCNHPNVIMFLDDSKKTLVLKNNEMSEEKFNEILEGFIQEIEVKDKQDFIRRCKTMCLFYVDNDVVNAQKIKDDIYNKYGSSVEVFRNQCFIDIVPIGCSKGEGLLRVLAREGLSQEDLYVVGDSFNDISMFNVTDNSYTFNNVEEGVKSLANNIIEHVCDIVESM